MTKILSKQSVKDLANVNIRDNGKGLITPTKHKEVMFSFLDSLYLNTDNASFEYEVGLLIVYSGALYKTISNIGVGESPLTHPAKYMSLSDALAFTPEDSANKSTDTSLGTSDVLFPTQNAVKTYVDTRIVGLLDDRGNFDASFDLFPTTGGSGTAGAIMKGDTWLISVAGTLGGVDVNIGDVIRAIVDTPGQTSSNWAAIEGNLGYVPENVTNKSIDGTFAANSDTLYPSQKATKTYIGTELSAKQDVLTFGNLTESTSSVLTITGGTGAIIGSGLSIQVKLASISQSGYISSTSFTTFTNKQDTISLTVSGSSGAATFITNTLNIPTYTLAGLGGVGGSGTTNQIPYFSGTSTLSGDSALVWDAAQDTITFPKWKPAANSTTALQFFKFDGTTPMQTFDSSNSKVILNTITQTAPVSVATQLDSNSIAFNTYLYNAGVPSITQWRIFGFGSTVNDGHSYLKFAYQNVDYFTIDPMTGRTSSTLFHQIAISNAATAIGVRSISLFNTSNTANNYSSIVNYQKDGVKQTASISFVNTNHGASAGTADIVFAGCLAGGTIAYQHRFVGDTGFVGFGTGTPTVKMQISASGAGAVYTKYSNSGTGELISNGTNVGLDNSNNFEIWSFQTATYRVGVSNTERFKIGTTGQVLFSNGVSTASSTVDQLFAITQPVNTSGTGGWTSLFVNTTDSGSGSGLKTLIDLQNSSVSKFKVSNLGLITATLANYATDGDAGTAGLTAGQLYRTSGAVMVKL